MDTHRRGPAFANAGRQRSAAVLYGWAEAAIYARPFAVDAADVEALTACIDYVVGALG